MSIAIDTDDTSDKINIDFNEDYRRTKRNVLFWATTTILIVIGTLGSDVPIETSWAQNIMLPPKLLTLGTWAVMTYMCVDFWHANNRLQIDNGTLKATIVLKGTVKASSELARKMRELKAELDVEGAAAIACMRELMKEKSISKIGNVEEHLAAIRRAFEKTASLEQTLGEFAGKVDLRDQAFHKIYYWGFTILVAVIATAFAAFRVVGPVDARRWVAEAIHVQHVSGPAFTPGATA